MSNTVARAVGKKCHVNAGTQDGGALQRLDKLDMHNLVMGCNILFADLQVAYCGGIQSVFRRDVRVGLLEISGGLALSGEYDRQ